MHNIKFIVAYDGSKYCGWQKQLVKRKHSTKRKQKPSIQETIEDRLKKILKHKVIVIASGRTDSGVHALGQVFNFKTSSCISAQKLRLALNSNLPRNIRISGAAEMPLDFHARYCAKSKVYRYLILNQDYKSPFLRDYSYLYKMPLGIREMKKAARIFLGRHDFKGFCASGSSIKDTKRTIKELAIKKINLFATDLISIEVEADGFLYNMVRNIVGTLVEVGRGRFQPSRIKKIIKSKDRSLAGPCVPAKGLYLVKVIY